MASLFSMSQGAKDHVRLKIHDREVFQKAFFTFLFFFVAFFGIFPHFLIRQSTRVKRGEEIKTKIFEIVILHCRYKQKKAGNKRIFHLSTFFMHLWAFEVDTFLRLINKLIILYSKIGG